MKMMTINTNRTGMLIKLVENIRRAVPIKANLLAGGMKRSCRKPYCGKLTQFINCLIIMFKYYRNFNNLFVTVFSDIGMNKRTRLGGLVLKESLLVPFLSGESQTNILEARSSKQSDKILKIKLLASTGRGEKEESVDKKVIPSQ